MRHSRRAGAATGTSPRAARAATPAAGRVALATTGFAARFAEAARTRVPRLRRVVVEGMSMAPALAPGDRLLVVTRRRPAPGAIVVVPDPRDRGRVLVKRVISVDSRNRTVLIEGDNGAASTDSRVFGPLAWNDIVGRAVYRYFPYARAGRLSWGAGGIRRRL